MVCLMRGGASIQASTPTFSTPRAGRRMGSHLASRPAPTVRGPGRGLISWFPPVLCRGHLRVQMSPGPPGACKSCLSVSALLPLRGMSKLPLFSSCMCQRLPRCLVFLSLLAGVKSTWNNPLCICVLGHRPRVRGHSRG